MNKLESVLRHFLAIAMIFAALAYAKNSFFPSDGNTAAADNSGKSEHNAAGSVTESTDAAAAESTTVAESTAAVESTAAPEHTYEVYKADVSWSTAAKLAEDYGGYLAVITSQEELDTVVKLIQEKDPDLKYLWLGGHSDGQGNFAWENGESFTFTPWFEGEPSFADKDGTAEDCLCLWSLGDWTFNDQRDDLPSMGDYVAGKIGYVVEYEK